LGGDDFDRALASHLLQAGAWRVAGKEGPSPTARGGGTPTPAELAALLDPTTTGAAPFAQLVRVAEVIKTQLTDADRGARTASRLLPDGRALSLEAEVDRPTFERLIKAKVERTIACCHEALARARSRAGLQLGDIDHVLLVGGSSRVPLVRRTVREAFCNPDLPERARQTEPLLHEPDLCV